MTAQAMLIKKSISEVLDIDINYVSVLKTRKYYSAGVKNSFFVDAQIDKSIDRNWNNLTNQEYIVEKINQAGCLEEKTEMLVSCECNKATFNFYECGK